MNNRLLSRNWWSVWSRRCRLAAADLLCPPQCQLCGVDVDERQAEVLLCESCLPLLHTLRGPVCPRCAAPVPLGSETKPDCLRCETAQFHFTAVVGLGIYQRELGAAALSLKQPFQEPLALTLGHLLADEVAGRWPNFQPDLVTPIPMHWWQRWKRGHNAPDLLAEAVARRLSASLATDALVCRRRAKKQSMLSPAERRTNMRGAFRASRAYAFSGLKILLIDDTLTTGATASEAARMLRNAGAAETRVAVVARGIGVD